jgi:hypothetical protein
MEVFKCAIIGDRKSGRTSSLIEVINTVYDNVYIFSSRPHNPIYPRIKNCYARDSYKMSDDISKLDEILGDEKYSKIDPESSTLIILDDIKLSETAVNLWIFGRPKNVSCIYVGTFFECHERIKRNSDLLVMKRCKDMMDIADENEDCCKQGVSGLTMCYMHSLVCRRASLLIDTINMKSYTAVYEP